MDEKKVEGQTQPQVSNAVNPAPGGNTNMINNPATQTPQQTAQNIQNPQTQTAPNVQPVQPQTQQTVNPPVQNVAPATPQVTTNANRPTQHTYNSATTVSKTAQRIDPFAEQNAKSAEKKKHRAKNNRIIIIVSTIMGIILLAAITWFVIVKINQPDDRSWIDDIPTINNDSDDSIGNIQRYLQNIYNDNEVSGNTKNSKLKAADQAVAKVLEHDNNSSYTSQIVLAQIQFYITNGYYNEIVNNAEKVDINNLTLQQKLSFYNCLALAYQAQGNQPKYDEYSNLMFEVSIELNGTGEYADE